MSTARLKAGSLGWFLQHEINLSWRDFMRMMSGGRKGREGRILVFVLVAILAMHAIAYLVLKPFIEGGIQDPGQVYAILTGSFLLTLFLMTSQALELVTRVFYSRSDLDLILSSPVSERRLFATRIGAIAFSTATLSVLLFGSAINILAIFVHWSWMAAYAVIFCCGCLATSLSIAVTLFLFKSLGASKTRLVSQIVAAVVGAGFIIGIQLAAITSIGSMSRIEFLQSEQVLDTLPDLTSLFWLPARAISGEPWPLGVLVLVSGGCLLLTIFSTAGRFGPLVLAATGVSRNSAASVSDSSGFLLRRKGGTLRRKEWILLLRDHWLISQTLMQILYLVPPAFMLWQGFGTAGALPVVAIPVLVMASGQLAGGLAWLAISGEDAPELVQTAPVVTGAVIRAKIEAVLGAVGVVVAPLLFIICLIDPWMMLIAAAGIAISAAGATMIQLWFRSQAKRSSFRRRQTSSKVATLAEAFSSILWAGTTGLAASGSALFVPTAALALCVLVVARSFRPERCD